MNKKTIHEIFLRFRQANPHPTTELVYHTQFELLIAVILSARATDKSVNKATEKLFKVASTPQKILKLGTSGLKEYIKNIGLYVTKAKRIMEKCKKLNGQFKSKIPHH